MASTPYKTYNTQDLEYNSLCTNYNIPGFPINLDREQLSAFLDMQSPLHWNDEMEIVYIEKGCMNAILNGECILLHENDILIINARCVHYFKSYKGHDCIYYCSLTNESIFTSAPEIKKKYIDPIYHSFSPNYVLITKDSKYHYEIQRVLHRSFELIETKPEGYELLVICCLHEFIRLLWALLGDKINKGIPVDKKEANMLTHMLTYIHENYDTKISIDELCQIGGVSRNRCFDIFKNYTDDTPSNYILKYRLRRAAILLRESNAPISEIAIQCGFSQQSHFTKHFSANYGKTPLHYRKGV